MDRPVGDLSGGEQARLLIARLMLEPADVLLLDEPTNDLDIPTLELLEESLMDFPGAIVLVTHDRYMLDRVSTVMLGLDGKGNATFVADYEQWAALQNQREYQEREEAKPKTSAAGASPSTNSKSKKLSYKEQREWDEMEGAIEKAEALLQGFQAELENPAHASNPSRLQELLTQVEAAQDTVDQLYARWAVLGAKVG
jgi:ATP-binding cassette subfamily F protein uup